MWKTWKNKIKIKYAIDHTLIQDMAINDKTEVNDVCVSDEGNDLIGSWTK